MLWLWHRSKDQLNWLWVSTANCYCVKQFSSIYHIRVSMTARWCCQMAPPGSTVGCWRHTGTGDSRRSHDRTEPHRTADYGTRSSCRQLTSDECQFAFYASERLHLNCWPNDIDITFCLLLINMRITISTTVNLLQAASNVTSTILFELTTSKPIRSRIPVVIGAGELVSCCDVVRTSSVVASGTAVQHSSGF